MEKQTKTCCPPGEFFLNHSNLSSSVPSTMSAYPSIELDGDLNVCSFPELLCYVASLSVIMQEKNTMHFNFNSNAVQEDMQTCMNLPMGLFRATCFVAMIAKSRCRGRECAVQVVLTKECVSSDAAV